VNRSRWETRLVTNNSGITVAGTTAAHTVDFQEFEHGIVLNFEYCQLGSAHPVSADAVVTSARSKQDLEATFEFMLVAIPTECVSTKADERLIYKYPRFGGVDGRQGVSNFPVYKIVEVASLT